MRHARGKAPLACRILGHFWYAVYTVTWGDDDRWVCKRCHRDGGVVFTKSPRVKSLGRKEG